MKYLFPLLFMLLTLAVISGAVIYLSRRMHFYFSGVDLVHWYILFTVVPVFMIGGLILFSNTMSAAGSLLYQAAAIITGLMLYLLLSAAAVHLLQLALKLPAPVYGIIVLSLTLVISLVGIRNAFHIRNTLLEVPMKGLPQQMRIVHLSDIHIGHFRGEKFLQKVVDMTNLQHPDAVFITGDLFDGRIHLTPECLKPLTQLSAPVYFVEGNHDGYTDVSTIKRLLREMDVNVLENQVVEVVGLQCIGLNHMHADGEQRNMHANGGGTIQKTLDSLTIDPFRPSILLHHSPGGVKYASDHGIDLYLAGHTHGGQLFPVTLLNGLFFPYNRGMHTYENTKIFVSQGVGTFGPPMRIGTNSEIVVMDLLPAI